MRRILILGAFLLLTGCISHPGATSEDGDWTLVLLDDTLTNALSSDQWSEMDQAVLTDSKFYDFIIHSDTGSGWWIPDGERFIAYRSWSWDWTNRNVLIWKSNEEKIPKVEQSGGE